MDHGFVDVVSARWSRLHRLAHLLAADDDRATGLLGDALARAHRRWAGLRSAEEAEAFVRAAMVDCLVAPRRRTTRRQVVLHDVPPDPAAPEAPDPEAALLWALVCALPARQRAVLVLLHHEELDPAEAGAVLRSSSATIRGQERDALGALARGLAAVRAAEASAETLVLGADGRAGRGGGQAPVPGPAVRAALRSAAGAHEAPVPDIDAMIERGAARTQQRRVLAAAIGTVVVAVAALGTVVARDARTPGARDPATRVDGGTLGAVESTGIPWCVPDPEDPHGPHLIVGEGAPIRAWCSWEGPGHADRVNYLWHHAGSTLLVTTGGEDIAYRVAGGRLIRLGSGVSGPPVFSHDGRYAAWPSVRRPGCRGTVLNVADLATASPVVRSAIPTPDCAWLDGIDDRGRVYVTSVGSQTSVPLDVRLYRIATRRWTTVTGVPGLANGIPLYTSGITYVTADGFAAMTDWTFVGAADPRHGLALASVEGVVDAHGRFHRVRATPIGRGAWSPDRSRFAQQGLDGVEVRAEGVLDRVLMLDLPDDRFRATADTIPHTSLQWLSATSLLVASLEEPPREPFLCDARSGVCEPVRAAGEPALANRALP
ncbi:hypothetical protein EKO23_10210 [Nocardioides guangzhouensis]|uniref:RNA polymerase sigma factor 70 region 4 type 2 domain-containing protein n=1 Tax=Nocardioides guangzhouensis TaxID=2497878 RepID=A0A4Q4ZFW3_9ACTN|nr:sigma-70 family RNA polymerase sigma factor [Nocardioides guangzhouensis]RYP86311.1 hypothetical protein EKO23_10210 [Nocardioides guangzhouensis]